LLNSVISGDRTDGDRWLAESYASGRALTTVGDEEAIRAIKDLCTQPDVPFNVQNWCRALAEDLEKHWREVARDWPEPWLPWSGQLEDSDARLTVGGKSFLTRLSLWYQRQEDPTDTVSWGGGFTAPSAFELMNYFMEERIEPIPLAIEGRRSSEIWLNAAGTDGYVSFVGMGPYPERV